MPGYDDLNTGRAGAFVRPRAGGEYYRQCWNGAIESGADWVVITSYNEWREGTQIETSAGYGDLYLNLTAELAAAYRQGVPSAPESGPTAIPAPTDTPRPTAPPPTETATALPIDTPTPTPTPTATQSPSPVPTTAAPPTTAPTLTRSPVPTPTRPAPATPTSAPTPTPTLAERTAAWPWSGWALGAALALLALGAVVWTLRLRGDVVGDGITDSAEER
jgi:hypothetical protein